MSELFAGFPPPQPGVMTLYVLGPGFGEAQVVSLPDGKWLVVDCCVSPKVNLPKALLEHFGVTQIDLLVVTHSHVDHLRGIPELLKTFNVRKVWRWAHAGTLDDGLPRLCAMLPANKRLRELEEVAAAIEGLGDANPNSVSDASIETRPWSGADYEVHPLSPTPDDVHSYRKGFDRLFEVKRGLPELSAEVQSFLGGTKKGVPMPGNDLSMALSVVWKSRLVILCGDVVVSKSAERGWTGVLKLLREEKREQLVRGATVVKASHHGSDGATSAAAWRLHAAGGKVAMAVVTPFASGPHPPPHSASLRLMSKQAKRLALTAVVKAAAAPARSGWVADVPTKPVHAQAAAVAVVIRESGPLELYVGKGARCFKRHS